MCGGYPTEEMVVPIIQEVITIKARAISLSFFCARSLCPPPASALSTSSILSSKIRFGIDAYGEALTYEFLCPSYCDMKLCLVSFVIVKITTICPMKHLERVCDLLRWQQKNFHSICHGSKIAYQYLLNQAPYSTLRKDHIHPLSREEEKDLELANQRLLELCQKCVQANILLFVDAEHATVQLAINYFTYSSTVMDNKYDNPIVYGTIQTYLKDVKERLLQTAKGADKLGVPMSYKLVRGAYMSVENRLAEY
ncbi:hypothetical protein RIF29_37146 [Crotalaria pallida]|uniref:Proline dehydrogenase n=1 Tax=Crotalaria pallida TaxID=3830 RepID=A0AAN9EC14_CROPI